MTSTVLLPSRGGPSRTEATLMPPPNATPSLTASSTATLPKSHSTRFTHKLRHLWEAPREASFVAKVTIHDLSNVPQLDGEFAVKWKFRGQKARDGDKLMRNPTPRIKPPTDVRPVADKPESLGVRTLRATASHQSLRNSSSTSLGSLIPHRGATLQAPHREGTPRQPHHSSSLPLRPLQPHRPPTIPAKAQEKQTSDPTSAGQGSGRRGGAGSAPDTPEKRGRVIVEEPEMMNSPDESLSEGPAGFDVPPLARARSFNDSRPPSTYSTGSLDTNGVTRTTSAHRPHPGAPTSSDTASIAGRQTSVRSDLSLTEGLPPSPTSNKVQQPQEIKVDATTRKGTTPLSPVRSHLVYWEYQISHTFNVPIGKPVEVTASTKSLASVAKSTTLPILGTGPKGESSIKLEVFQVDARTALAAKNSKIGKHDYIEQTLEREMTEMGYVDIDLAPFVDHGPTTRRFLLKDSKTNATIRITVDMRFIGGEQIWVAPQLQEGHHVAGITDLTGEENTYPEVQLLPTQSTASSSSSLSSMSGPRSINSRNSNVSLTKGSSSMSAVTQATRHRYKTYEHHLRPEHSHRHSSSSTTTEGTGTGSGAHSHHRGAAVRALSTMSTPSDLSSTLSPGVVSEPRRLLPSDDAPLTTSPQSLGSSPRPPPLSPLRLDSIDDPGYFDTFPASLSAYSMSFSPLSPVSNTNEAVPLSPTSVGMLSPDNSPTQRRRRHRQKHFLHSDGYGTEHLPPDVVIENIFNPAPNKELTPFTYVPGESDGDDDDDHDDDDDDDYDFVGGGDDAYGGSDATSALQLDVDADGRHPQLLGHGLQQHGHGRWNRIRRRVLSNNHNNQPPRT